MHLRSESTRCIRENQNLKTARLIANVPLCMEALCSMSPWGQDHRHCDSGCLRLLVCHVTSHHFLKWSLIRHTAGFSSFRDYSDADTVFLIRHDIARPCDQRVM